MQMQMQLLYTPIDRSFQLYKGDTFSKSYPSAQRKQKKMRNDGRKFGVFCAIYALPLGIIGALTWIAKLRMDLRMEFTDPNIVTDGTCSPTSKIALHIAILAYVTAGQLCICALGVLSGLLCCVWNWLNSCRLFKGGSLILYCTVYGSLWALASVIMGIYVLVQHECDGSLHHIATIVIVVLHIVGLLLPKSYRKSGIAYDPDACEI